MSTFRVGSDIGGTFTDIVMIDETGSLERVKVPSTPPDFYEGLLHGLRTLSRPLADMSLLAHGTTVGINAIISRHGARTGLITTKGFRDTLAIRRGDRADQFNLWWQPQPELVPRRHRFEVNERVNYAGEVVRPLIKQEVEELAARLKPFEFESLSIVLINSFVNPTHEQQLASILEQLLPNVYISTSHEILPEILEYERTSTTTVNAYIGPVVANYIKSLASEVASEGYEGSIVIGTSAGGVATPDIVRRVPARTIESGPAAGVMAAREIAALAGYERIVTFDMGGTSLDLGIIDDGQVRRSNEYDVEWRTPVRFPCVDVFSIGAGGGSIAWIDRGGSLRSGPQSAGARPGPACYGTGGDQPTNTDAQVALGRMRPENFLGGEMAIYPELAREAIDRHIGQELNFGTEQAAAGILAISNNNMLQSLRIATVERGYDPREFSLFAFGGAGPLYAADVARQGNIGRVVVPRYPGLISALGLLLIDIRHDVSHSVMLREEDARPAHLTEQFHRLEKQIAAVLAAEGIGSEDVVTHREADVRYLGQSESLTVHVQGGELGDDEVADLFEAFRATQEKEYGYLMPAEVATVEVVTLRVAGIGRVEKAKLEPIELVGIAKPAFQGSRDIVFDADTVSTPIYEREYLGRGSELEGPAIVQQIDSTTVVPPASHATVDSYGNLVIAFD